MPKEANIHMQKPSDGQTNPAWKQKQNKALLLKMPSYII